jgi:hypothetical protein
LEENGEKEGSQKFSGRGDDIVLSCGGELGLESALDFLKVVMVFCLDDVRRIWAK